MIGGWSLSKRFLDLGQVGSALQEEPTNWWMFLYRLIKTIVYSEGPRLGQHHEEKESCYSDIFLYPAFSFSI